MFRLSAIVAYLVLLSVVFSSGCITSVNQPKALVAARPIATSISVNKIPCGWRGMWVNAKEERRAGEIKSGGDEFHCLRAVLTLP